MKPLMLVVCVSLAGSLLAATEAPPPLPSDPRARELIAQRTMGHVLGGETGYYAPIGVSTQYITVGKRKLSVQSSSYCLLTPEQSTNYLQWLESDETHVLLEGGPVDYYIFSPNGVTDEVTLGLDAAAGQRRAQKIPGGCGRAFLLHSGAPYALLVRVTSPESTPDRTKVGAGPEFISRYGTKSVARAGLLRALIGPNYRP